MTRTMVLLPGELHKRLKHVAIERESSLSSLIREAVERMFQEDLEDITKAEAILKTFTPGTGIPYESYRAKRLKKKP